MRKNLIIIILSTIIISCNQENKAPITAAQNSFFDLKQFFEQEIKTTLKGVKKVKKTVTVNGKVETKIVELKNWEDELSPFTNADINRPAWRDKYLIKEVPLPNAGVQKEYYALADILKTRNIIVSQMNNETAVSILNQEKTTTSDNTTVLKYETGKGYNINTTQRLLNSTDTIIIDALFVKD